MRLKNIKINGVDVSPSNSGILFTQSDWTTIRTKSDSNDIVRSHSRRIAPTQATYRTITLEWVIDFDWNPNAEQSLKHLQDIFRLQNNLYTIEPLQVEIEDVFWNLWNIECVMWDTFEYREFSENFLWYAMKWRAVLESVKSPFCYSIDETEYTWTNGTVGNVAIPLTVPFDIAEARNPITIAQSGNAEAPIRRELEVTATFTWPITIYDLSKWLYTRFDQSWVAGDIFIIDWKNKTATKNWNDITAYREIGSSRLWVLWETKYVVQLWTTLLPVVQMNVSAFCNDVML